MKHTGGCNQLNSKHINNMANEEIIKKLEELKKAIEQLQEEIAKQDSYSGCSTETPNLSKMSK